MPKHTTPVVDEGDAMKLFCSEKHASFAERSLLLVAKDRFERLHSVESVVFLEFVAPNGHLFVRVFDPEVNKAFIEFLERKFKGHCILHPAE